MGPSSIHDKMLRGPVYTSSCYEGSRCLLLSGYCHSKQQQEAFFISAYTQQGLVSGHILTKAQRTLRCISVLLKKDHTDVLLNNVD